MSNTRAERMHMDNTARARRQSIKNIRVVRMLSEWAKQRRSRKKHKK